jgi:hypothetical protein
MSQEASSRNLKDYDGESLNFLSLKFSKKSDTLLKYDQEKKTNESMYVPGNITR